MASKSKDVRIEQRRLLEKKLELRLAKLAAEGVAKEKAQSDSIVKNLKSKIRESNARIAAIDKNSQKIQDLAKAKEEKLAAKAVAKVADVAPEKEGKSKKKAAEKDGKKPAGDGDAKKAKKKKEGAA